jgi:hypothetical protein
VYESRARLLIHRALRPRVGMVYVSEHAKLSELQRKISARKKKKKKEGVWRDLCIFFGVVVAAAAFVLFLLPFAPLGRVEASSTELVHAYGGTGSDIARCVIEHSIDQGLVIAGYTSVTVPVLGISCS